MDDQVRQAIAQVLPAAADAAPDASLTCLGLDSIAVVRLVRRIEQTCGVSIPLAQITERNFSTMNSVQALVRSLR